MASKQRHFRQRYLLFTRTDEKAFSRALREAYENIRFNDEGPFNHQRLPLRRCITACQKSHIQGFIPEAGWEPVVERNKRFGYDHFVNVPRRYHFLFARCEWHWMGIPRMSFDDSTLESGWITSWFDRDDAKEKAFVRKIWRILDKMTVNRYKVEYPHLGRVIGETKRETWAGHDALRWCSQGKARMLSGLWRPTDGWSFPELSYYDGLPVGNPPEVCWREGSGQTL